MNLRKEHKQYNLALFKRWAPVYDLFALVLSPLRKRVAKMVEKRSKGGVIFDAACGTGAQSIAFADRGFEVVGVDLSPDMLAKAKKKIRCSHKIKFIAGDASKVNYADNHFDVSSISFALHDMPESIAVDVLREMKRLTKSGGVIVIVDYDQRSRGVFVRFARRIVSLWESKYYHRFLDRGLLSYLKKAGLEQDLKENVLWGNVQIVFCKI